MFLCVLCPTGNSVGHVLSGDVLDLKDKHILVLGLGESGLAMARWCLRQGARVRVADTRAHLPNKAALNDAEFIAGEFQMSLLENVDLLALSPGLPASLPVVVEAWRRGISVTGEIELFAQGLRAFGLRDRAKVIAITGTNGKTTTTALTGHLCRAGGKTVEVAGNISPAALDALMACQDEERTPDVWVLELSSFQLETLETLNADAATALNVSDDHLDRYAGLDGYAAAKARIFYGEGVQVLNRQDHRVMEMALPGRRAPSFGLDVPTGADDFGLREQSGAPWIARCSSLLLPVAELPMAGLHNAANVMAALALCEAIGLQAESLLTALRNFKGLPHRLERIAEIDGVAWYDDSKGTNVGATVAALTGLGPMLSAQRAEHSSRLSSLGREDGRVGESFASGDKDDSARGRIVLIAGGDGKGQDFSPLKAACALHARAVVLIGRDGSKIRAAVEGIAAPLLAAATLEQAVGIAAEQAHEGDAVLLSPACASFDMFRNYEHRAEVFVAAVRALAEQAA